MPDDSEAFWPSLRDFNEAIQTPHLTLHDPELQSAEPLVNDYGLPISDTGNFATVYRVRVPASGREWAVKCFTMPIDQRSDRYRAISDCLSRLELPYTVGFEYIPHGIRVGDGLFPILKMEWVEGDPLHCWVDKLQDNSLQLRELFDNWIELASALRDAGIAHGDLQHENVIVRPAGSGSVALTLVDYDGFFVPALAASPPAELGHPAYQHPLRFDQKTFNSKIDRFAILVVACAIRAVSAHGRELWYRYEDSDNLLFRESDFQAPGESDLFHQLRKSKDPLTRNLAGQVILATDVEIDEIPFLPELLQERPDAALLRNEEQAVESILSRKTPPRPELRYCPECNTQIPAAEFESHVRHHDFDRSSRADPLPTPTPDAPTEPSSRSGHKRRQRSRAHLVAAGMVVAAVVIAASQSRFRTVQKQTQQNSSPHNITTNMHPAARISPAEAQMVLIPSGEFMMGTDVHIPKDVVRIGSLDGDNSEAPSHLVEISQPFELGNFAVTQGEWIRVMNSKPWEGREFVKEGDRFPATYVSWLGAVRYCNALSRSEGLSEYYSIADEEFVTIPDQSGEGYRLPTEAEWEYACRGGTSAKWSFPSDESPADFAWFGQFTPEGIARFAEFSGNATANNATLRKQSELSNDGQLTLGTDLFAKEVGQKKPNPFGLYDMHGNVEQWCWDWYATYLPGPVKDPMGSTRGRSRIARGGRWDWSLAITRSASRSMAPPTYRGASTGFRVARTRNSGSRSHPQAPTPVSRSASDTMTQTLPSSPVFVEMTLIPAGEFRMGSPTTLAANSPRFGRVVYEDKHRSEDEGPQHLVRITSPFYLGAFEVTQEQYSETMAKNPSRFSSNGQFGFRTRGKDTVNYPVESVSWFDALEFCNRLSKRNGHDAYYRIDQVERSQGSIVSATVTRIGGRGFRLPSEAEWEYACRAGTTTPYHCGSELDFDTANFEGNSAYGTYSYRSSKKGRYLGRPTTVGSYPANAFGLHDMHGNVYEWCWDRADDSYYSTYESGVAVDPLGPTIGTKRIARGGGFDSSAQATRSAYRGYSHPAASDKSIGFRVARTK